MDLPYERVRYIQTTLLDKYGPVEWITAPPDLDHIENPIEVSIKAWREGFVRFDELTNSFNWVGSIKQNFPLFTDMVEMFITEIRTVLNQ